MRRMICGALTAIVVSGAALAKDKCDAPIADWIPRNVLKAKLEADGWKVSSIKTEDGCYEALAIDAHGEKVVALFNPKSLDAIDQKSGY